MALVDTDSYYNLLGVDKKASNAEIKRAYFVRARQFHPDKNPDDPQAEAKVCPFLLDTYPTIGPHWAESRHLRHNFLSLY